MLSRRQKRSLRTFSAALSFCLLISGILVYQTMTNGFSSDPVVVSDILEGAMIQADELPERFSGNVVTLGEDALTETMFFEELRVFTETDPPLVTTTDPNADMAQGAGGTLLLKTTPKTTAPPETMPTKTEPPVVTEPSAETSRRTTSAATRPPVTTTPRTTAASAATRTSASSVHINSESSKPPFTNVGGGVMSDDNAVYLKMMELVNNARKEAGLGELWYSARLHDVCNKRVVELTSYYSHTRPNGTKFSTAFSELGITFNICGENIAYGRNMFKTPEEVFEAWMNSQSHRENILYPDYECAAFGLSVIKVGADTYYYWTQEFAKL